MDKLTSKRWHIAPQAPDAFVSSLSSVHPLIAQILYNRGLADLDAVESHLDPEIPPRQPFELSGVAEAVTLIRRIIDQQRPIVVYGDYDVDGVTAVAVLVEAIQALGGLVEPYIPSREEEGYGLNKYAIRTLASEGVKLLITADCGIRSRDEVALARQLRMHVIITDHHDIGIALPSADVVINPKLPQDPPGLRQLAGVGVAYKLAQGLLRVNRRTARPMTVRDLDEESLLDLVALGTVADMVDLLGENRRLVTKGLEEINSGRRPGLNALMQVAVVSPGSVTTKTIGFVIAPRLNAAGRLDEADTALKLLLARDMAEAMPLAEQLEELNERRREIAREVREKAREMVVTEPSLPPLIFAASRDFPQGVVGLAASRLLDEFYRPAVVVSVEDDYSKGSARSIPEFHITEALDRVDGLLERHGGHAAAAGFTVKTSRLGDLKTRLLSFAKEQLQDLVLVPSLDVDAEVALTDLTDDLYRRLQCLQPFGYGNPEPVFVSRRVKVLNARTVGSDGHHLKLYIGDAYGKPWEAIAFRQGHWIDRLPSWIDLAYTLEKNEWNGRSTLQLNVQDIHLEDGLG
ncbi:MAG: single-stranded-DNA-specific exonuclease RecJ [Anaerolineae bacterium]